MVFKKITISQLKKHPIVYLMRSLFTGVLIVATGMEIGGIISTGYINPINQARYYNNQEAEKLQKEEKYNESYRTFLNYVDSDKNGYINIKEQTEAWKKLGFEGPFYEPEGESQEEPFIESKRKFNFPKPDLTQLEKAIETYKQK